MAAATCTHLDDLAIDAPPSSTGCEDCRRIGSSSVHLRRRVERGHRGCCDTSPDRHAIAHPHGSSHLLVQSYELGEDRLWCHVGEAMLEVRGQPPSPSHP